MTANQFSLHKARSLLRQYYALYKKREKRLNSDVKERLYNLMKELDLALLAKDKEKASKLAHELDDLGHTHLRQTWQEQIFHFLFGLDSGWSLIPSLVLALGIALLVRQMWFEPFEIPTGSMRPTFKEQDHLTVTKTAFGINYPLKTEHLYFDPSLIERTSIVIFSGDQLPMLDSDSTFLWVFPYKKRFIKRLMGKPGDSVYFYGGKVYVVDQDGNPQADYLKAPWMEKIEHVPFLSFEGEKRRTREAIEFYQMHLPLGRLTGQSKGEVFDGKQWVKDDPAQTLKPHNSIQTYSDFLGIRNYGMARLLTKDQLTAGHLKTLQGLDNAPLYLEIRHHPSLTYPLPHQDQTGISLTPQVSILALTERHLNAIMDNMYTARFVVKNGRASRYNAEGTQFNSMSPRFENVPDGTYEFYHGKALKVGWGAITSELPPHHPLYDKSISNIQKLYNLGIEMNLYYEPRIVNQNFYPNRYAYFRDGDLYLLGAPILKKDDPVLIAFLEREQQREKQSSDSRPYAAFKDYGPPLKDGRYDTAFIQAFGLKIPEKHYLVLGDNHAMSSDSRVFGTIPEGNLQGAPSYIIWPFGDRLGSPPQKPYPTFTTPRIIVWSAAALIAAIWYFFHRRNLKRPIVK